MLGPYYVQCVIFYAGCCKADILQPGVSVLHLCAMTKDVIMVGAVCRL